MLNKDPLVSIVVPVYNVEAYLQRCVTSILTQTYKNIEIILVDDGSTDGSGEICERIKEKESNIVVVHQKNGGLSAARNTGINIAKGQYIAFVDSDDFIKEDLIEYLFDLLIRNNCPMALCSLGIVEASGKYKRSGSGDKIVLSAHQCIEKMLYHDEIEPSACGKLYEKRLFADIRFPEGKYFEDIGTIHKLFYTAKKIACGFSDKYIYCIRENSITTGAFQPKKLDMLQVTDQMGNEVLRWFPDLNSAVICRRVEARFSTLNQMFNVDGAYLKKRESLIVFIKEHRKYIIKDKKSSKRLKMAILALELGWGFYKMSWRLYRLFMK